MVNAKRHLKKIILLVIVVIMLLSMSACVRTLLSLAALSHAASTNTYSENRVYRYGDSNDLAVTFYDGHMYAIWDTGSLYDYTLKVTTSDNEATYNSLSDYFSDGQFDLEAIGLTYNNSFSLELTESYTNPLTLQTSKEVYNYSYEGLSAYNYQKYTTLVDAGFSDIDFYVATRAEFFELWSYMVIYRDDVVYDKEKEEYNVSFDVYMGYDYITPYQSQIESRYYSYVDTAEECFYDEIASCIDAYEDSAAYSYAYSLKKDEKSATVVLSFGYDLTPSYKTNAINEYENATTSDVYAHYLNNDTSLVSRTFAIDSVTNTAPVESSDQLYFCLKKGYKPVCKQGSQAESLYSKMRTILTQIILDTNTEAEKVHYIYDWIVDNVIYDYDFEDAYELYEKEKITIDDLLDYRCMYLEGVFEDKVAICDGLSKAFECMAKIEGLTALKIGGTSSGSGHAWNKVKVNGIWYMVDTTWGNTLSTTKSASNKYYEYLNHSYLMVKDDTNHVENDYITYPSCSTNYHWTGSGMVSQTTPSSSSSNGRVSPGWRHFHFGN